jgi:hypothetical protein
MDERGAHASLVRRAREEGGAMFVILSCIAWAFAVFLALGRGDDMESLEYRGRTLAVYACSAVAIAFAALSLLSWLTIFLIAVVGVLVAAYVIGRRRPARREV